MVYNLIKIKIVVEEILFKCIFYNQLIGHMWLILNYLDIILI